MKSFIITIFLIFGLSFMACADSHFEEVNTKFIYKNTPIHPWLIKSFNNWFSDGGAPIVTTLDIAAAFDTNQYSNDDVKKRGDWWFVEHGEGQNYEEFGYKWLGRLNNGTHVLEITDGGGGSGVFMSLFFLKISEGVIEDDGKSENQLLMQIVKKQTLGDRYDGDIKVYSNKVFIPAGHYPSGDGVIDRDITLTF